MKTRLCMRIEIILMIAMCSVMEGVNHAVQQLMGTCNYIVMWIKTDDALCPN